MLDKIDFQGSDGIWGFWDGRNTIWVGSDKIQSIKGHLNEKTFHTIIETMKHGYAIRSGLGLVLSPADTDTNGHGHKRTRTNGSDPQALLLLLMLQRSRSDRKHFDWPQLSKYIAYNVNKTVNQNSWSRFLSERSGRAWTTLHRSRIYFTAVKQHHWTNSRYRRVTHETDSYNIESPIWVAWKEYYNPLYFDIGSDHGTLHVSTVDQNGNVDILELKWISCAVNQTVKNLRI